MLVNWNPYYVACRLLFWTLLWILVHIDALQNRSSRGRGWRLHRGILTFLSSELLFQSLHLAIVIKNENQSSFDIAESSLFKAEIFLDWLSRSIFLCLLLLIASGYCILRDTLGESTARVFGMPTVYGVTSMIFDYILVTSANKQIVTQRIDDDGDDLDTEALKGLLLITCLLIKAVVFVCAWVIVFESVNAEIRILKNDHLEEVVVTVEEHDEEEDAYRRPQMQDVADSMEGRTPDEPKTIADAVGDQAKLLLLTRFRTALVIYVVSYILVNMLPLYLFSASGQTAQNVVTVLENLVLLAFVSTLSIIFRPVGDNPYLLLTEDFEEVEGKEVTTELGVMANDTPPVRETIPTEENNEVISDRGRFSLGGDEEEFSILQLERQVSGGSTPMAAIAHHHQQQEQEQETSTDTTKLNE